MTPVRRPSSSFWALTFVLMEINPPRGVIRKRQSGRGCVCVTLCGGIPPGREPRHSGKAAGGVATFPCCDHLTGAQPPHSRPVQNNNRKLVVCGVNHGASDCFAACRQSPACVISLSAARFNPSDEQDSSTGLADALELKTQQNLKNVNENKSPQMAMSCVV